MTIQMTRAEYEAKYGTAPALPPVAAPTVSAPVVKPTSTTVKMTRAEYEAKYKEAPSTTSLEEKPKAFGDRLIPQILTGSTQKFGKTIGEALAAPKNAQLYSDSVEQHSKVQSDLLKTIRDRKVLGQDTSRLENALKNHTASTPKLEDFTGDVINKTAGQVLGEAGGTAVEALSGGLLSSGVKTVASKTLSNFGKIKEGAKIGSVFGGITGTTGAMQDGDGVVDTLKSGVGSAVAGGFLGGAIPGVVAGVGAFQRGAKATIPKVAEMVRPVTDIVSDIGGGIARTPKRIATNIAERQGEVQVIKSLPTAKAREAAFNGIDIPDVKTVLNINKEVKPAARELVDNVIKFAKRETSQDPITSVGKPIVAKLRELESKKNIVGGKLEVAARNIGIVTKQELQTSVFNRIQKVKGLEGLGINSKGKLDFSKTTLASDFSRADRNAIQTAYNQSIKWGDGYKAHLFRQELFSVLGGKKRAFGTVLTDTQEKGLDAIRAGLSDVLETKSTGYKELSNQYREIIQPLSAINKKLKAISGTPENALEMNAGLLARRLTSTSMSQGELETILTAMDKATGAKGTFFKNTKELQNIYNVLDRYYQIIPQTGFKGQSQAAFEGAQGLGDLVVKTARGLAGQTPAVRQKALEDLLNEVLAGAKKTNFGR